MQTISTFIDFGTVSGAGSTTNHGVTAENPSQPEAWVVLCFTSTINQIFVLRFLSAHQRSKLRAKQDTASGCSAQESAASQSPH